MMKFEVPEYDFKAYRKLIFDQSMSDKEIVRQRDIYGTANADTYSELNAISHKIGEEKQKQIELIKEFEKKYPGYSLEIYNNEEFIVFNVLLMNTAELIKDYYRSKKIKMHPLTSELKRLKENLTKILSDSKIVKNISESTYNELSEINDEVREELEIRENRSDSPFKWFEKSMKGVYIIKRSIK